MFSSLNQLSGNRAGVDGVSRRLLLVSSNWHSPASATAVGTIEEDANVFKCFPQFHERDVKGATS